MQDKDINALLDACALHPEEDAEWYANFIRLRWGGYSILFLGHEDTELYRAVEGRLYRQKQDIADTVSFKTFQGKFAELLGRLKTSGAQADGNTIKEFLASFLAGELTEREVLYQIHGLVMHEATLRFGDFTIYNVRLALPELVKKYPKISDERFQYIREGTEYLIGIRIKARETDKVIELSDALCRSFENVCSYVIGDLDRHLRIAILNWEGHRWIRRIICHEEGMVQANYNPTMNMPVPMHDPIFMAGSRGTDRLWDLITKQDRSDMEQRILTAVEWIGKAVADRDMSKSFVQFVFAMESVLQNNTQEVVTPSILSRMSDSLAFILGDNLEHRIRIVSNFKEIYKKRSAIAHGSSKAATEADIHVAFEMASYLIVVLLTRKPFSEMTKIEDLEKHLVNVKFRN